MTRRKLLITLPVVIMAVIMVMQLCGCAVGDELKSCSSASEVMDAFSADLFGEGEQEYTQLNVTLPRHSGYAPMEEKWGYNSLENDEERLAYESMEQALFRITEEDGGEYGEYQLCRAVIPKLDSIQVFMVKEALEADHPEAFWFNGNYSFGRNYHDGLYVILYSSMSAEEIENGSQALTRRVSAVLKEIPSGLNEYDRELIIHDILVRDIVYDHAAADNMDLAPEAGTVYGAFVEQRAVCSGYALAAKLLLNRVGVSCITVSGFMHNDTENGHMWNLVCIDGNWYHLDVTNDDPTSYSTHNIRSYNYFNLTDSAIAVTHFVSPDFSQLNEETVQWGDGASNFYNFPMPVCRSEKDNYYKKNAVAVTSLNDDGRRIIAEVMNRKIIEGENTIYLVFPSDMDPDVISDWFNSFMYDEIDDINASNQKSGNGCWIENYTYAQGATEKWCNVFIIKLITSGSMNAETNS